MKRTHLMLLALGAIMLGWAIRGTIRDDGLTRSFGPGDHAQALPENASNQSAGSVDIAMLRQELASVQSEMARVKTALVSLSAQPLAANDRDAPTVDTGSSAKGHSTIPRSSKPPTAEATARMQQANFEAIEAGFGAEPTDAAWANKVTDLVKGAVADKGAEGNDIQMLECRSTLCRVEVFHSTPAAKAGFLHNFAFKVGSELPELTIQPIDGADGTSISRIYLARNGHALPPLNPEEQFQ